MAILNDDRGTRASQADLGDIARVCVNAARATHEVALDLESGEHVVPGDRVLLRRAVGNLLDNACRATPDTGRIVVRVGSSDAGVWIEVTDEGPGFGEITPGSGLGLQVARAAVWASGGRLRIETGPWSGTTIRMSFPVALRAL